MNYIRHLAGFFERVASDERLNPTHISMYVSLFQFWNANRFQNPISISRGELMKVSKISAKATYHKCMKELHDWQYLKYKPSYNPFKGSLVYLFTMQAGLPTEQAGSEQAVVADHTKIGTSVEQAQEPYINISKHYKQNGLNLGEPAQKNEVQNLGRLEKKEKEKLRQKKKKDNTPLGDRSFAVPVFNEIQDYFKSQKYPLVEASKFYNYFQSNGWLVGGRTKMKDWKAAARNWMLNADKFAKGKPVKLKSKHLHATTNKNYNEPL
jgi:hypothetical protein